MSADGTPEAFDWMDQLDGLTDEWKDIESPLLDDTNDVMGFYARIKDGRLQLSDDGETCVDLDNRGVHHTRHALSDAIRGFGDGFRVNRREEIVWEGRPDDRYSAANRFLACMAACRLKEDR